MNTKFRIKYLGANSVAFYQLTKVALVPFMVMINFVLYGTKTRLSLCFSLAMYINS